MSEPKCAICGRPVAEEYRPFCSKRCADVDLGRWLTGSYVIPGEDLADDEISIDKPHGTGHDA